MGPDAITGYFINPPLRHLLLDSPAVLGNPKPRQTPVKVTGMMESLSQEAAAAQLLGRPSGIDENASPFGCSFRVLDFGLNVFIAVLDVPRPPEGSKK